MKRKEKLVRKFLPCALLDYTGLQDWLNEQAKAGYALAHWPKFTFVGQVAFRRDPAAVHSRYCLDPIGEWIS